MTPAELRRSAREAEHRGQLARAESLRHQADVAELREAAAARDLSGLTVAELEAFLQDAAARVREATAELARRRGKVAP